MCGCFGTQDLLSNTEIKEKQAVSNAEALKAAHVEALSSVQKSQQTANQDSTAYKAMADKLSLLESQHEHAKKESAQVEVVLKQTREMLKDAQAEVAVRGKKQTTRLLCIKIWSPSHPHHHIFLPMIICC